MTDPALRARLDAELKRLRSELDAATPDTPEDVLDRLMTLWQEPWSEPAFGEAQVLLADLRAALAAAEAAPLDVDRSKPCPFDPLCYRYQGHDGEHMYAEPKP